MKVISFHFLWLIADSMTDITPHLSIIMGHRTKRINMGETKRGRKV